MNQRSLSFGSAVKVLLSLVVVQAMMSPPSTLAWDAGTQSRRHYEGTGGENPIWFLDTRPFWAQSRSLTNSGRVADCPAGYTNTGLTCYREPSTIHNPSILANCPAGYTNMGASCFRGAHSFGHGCKRNPGCPPGYRNTGCTCFRGAHSVSMDHMTCPAGYTRNGGRCYRPCPSGYTNNGEFCGRGASSLGMSSMTCAPNEVRLKLSGGEIPRCYNPPVCPDGYEYWGFLCYIAGPPGVTRTAVSTVKMNVRQSGNTHLWIVNRALELLARSDDPGARSFAAMMNQPAIRTKWESGLWDADGPSHVDFPNHMGTHFYNAAGLNWLGNPTRVVTYDIVAGSMIPILTPAGVPALIRLYWKNRSNCQNARVCATDRLAKLGGGLNESNAYELGLALHYMTDLTQPMHTSGFDAFKIPNNLHPQYEYYAAFVQGNWPATDMRWDKRWIDRDPDGVLIESSLKSNTFAPRLSRALNIDGSAGIVTIPGFNGIGLYTGFNFYHDRTVNALTGEILRDAYQSTASFLYSVYKKTSQ